MMKYLLFDTNTGHVERLWMPTKHGLDTPTDAYIQSLQPLQRLGLYTVEPGQFAGGGGFAGGSGGSTDTFVMTVMDSGWAPSASTAYYVGFGATAGSPGGSLWYHQVVPVGSTLAVVYYSVFVAGTNPTSASVTHKVEKNGTSGVAGTATTGATIDWNGANAVKKTATESPAMAFSAGDSWQYTISTPAWATAPTSVTTSASLKFTNP